MASQVKLFVSHAHRDVEIAKRLVWAFEAGMEVPAKAIRCTSVPGYGFELGAMAPDKLRQELASAEVVIGILTPYSLACPWVLFELGATWSLFKQAIPLLGGGLKDNDIPGPFRGAAGGQLKDFLALSQLLEQLAKTLGWPQKNLEAARAHLHELANHVGSMAFFDDDVEQEVKATFGAKRARIGAQQGAIVDYITHNRHGRPNIPQDELYEQFKTVETHLYYRLEQLRYLGFLSKRDIGKKGPYTYFGWTLSKKYQAELG